MSILFCIIGILCLLYCLSIGIFAGHGTLFFLVWAVIGIVLLLLSVILKRPQIKKRIPLWVQRGFWISFTAGILAFLVTELFILGGFNSKASDDADYIIVLGAQWKEKGPSYVLQKRLDSALAYLESNPRTKVIVSGGQGPNEYISEAQGMGRYLQAKGVDKSKILYEDQSTDTCENLSYSGKLCNKEKDKVIIITNNFHVYRAVKMAKKIGYGRVEGLAADSHPLLLPNNLLRECLAVWKAGLLGNI